MKIIEKAEATAALEDDASNIASGPVVVTDHGLPVAALVPLENADLETASLSFNRQFLELIERSRASARKQGGVPSAEMRRKFKRKSSIEKKGLDS